MSTDWYWIFEDPLQRLYMRQLLFLLLKLRVIDFDLYEKIAVRTIAR